MIVPMKKAFLLVRSKDAAEAVRTLRSLGLVHVENQETPHGVDIAELREDAALASGALTILSGPDFTGKKCFEDGVIVKDWKAAAQHVIDSWKRLDQLEDYSRRLRSTMGEWEKWGHFDPASVTALDEKGVHVRLYEIPVAELKQLPPEAVVKRIFTAHGVAGCAIITRDSLKIPFKEVELPKASLEDMRRRLNEDLRTIQAIKANMLRHLCYRETFKRIRTALEHELELHEAVRGMGQSGEIAYLAGYVPLDRVKRLQDEAARQRWGIMIQDPSEEDTVPTLVRNPRWVALIEPVFKMLEIVPGYRELDISLFFLLFFSVFFGMLIGDAGYGAIYFCLTLFAQKKFGAKMKDKSVFILLYVLSLAAVVWGLLSGTIFGQEWLTGTVKPLVPALRNDVKLQAFCFFLGALQLSIAHGWRALLKFPALQALADVGWIVVLWGVFFLAKVP